MELFLWWQKDLNASIIWIQTFKYFWILLQHHLYCFFFLNSNTAFNMNGNSNVLNKLKKKLKKIMAYAETRNTLEFTLKIA